MAMHEKTRNVFFVFLGVIGLLLKRHYGGPCQEIIFSYGGNISASFATYFVVSNLRLQMKFRSLLTAAMALTIVELFEISNGFGLMTNTYDPFDLVANAAGILLAWMVGALTDGFIKRRMNRG
ncbi:MAG TPA: hypothetical protein PLY04_17610 [bacterium]|nr:hypothetical protein [bacterium]